MGEKVATNDVISKLVSALGDERKYVRGKACETLGRMGEKAATNDVISKLVSALGDESELVRETACEALGEIGEKAATNDVISKLVSALGDESECVRKTACKTLERMGEKAATDEVISVLMVLLNSGKYYSIGWKAGKAIENILSSSASVTQLSPKTVSDLCLDKNRLTCLKNISADQLINIFFTSKNANWLRAVSKFSLQVGVAVTVTGEKIVVYDRKEPVELFVPTLKLRKELIKALTDQAKQLHLAFESLS
jgi:HEAT repeat protein